MGLMLNRVNELVTDAGITTHPEVNTLYQSAINEVISILPPEELLSHSPTPVELTNSSTSWTLPGEVRILNVFRTEDGDVTREAKEVDKATFSAAGDSNSLYFATNNSPVYSFDNSGDEVSTLKVLPDFDALDTGEVYYFKYYNEGEHLVDSDGIYLGDFSSQDGWATLSSDGWGDGVGSLVGTSATGTLTWTTEGYQPALKANTEYVVSLDISGSVTGSFTISVGDGAASNAITTSTKLTLSTGGTPTTAELTITPTTFAGTIDNISLKIADGSSDLATDSEPGSLPELAHYAVALRTAINILLAKISDAVQNEEDNEIQQMLNAQIGTLQALYKVETEKLSGGHND